MINMWSNRQMRRTVAYTAIIAGLSGMIAGGLVVTVAGPSAPVEECVTVECVTLYPEDLSGGAYPDDLEVEITFTPEVTDPYARCRALMTTGQIPVTVGRCVR